MPDFFGELLRATVMLALLHVAQHDLRKLQGEWVDVDETYCGLKPFNPVPGSIVMTIDGNSFKVFDGGIFVCDGTFVAYPQLRPRQIDLLYESGAARGKVGLGIYKFDGDRLIICSDVMGGRPPDFVSKKDSFTSLIVWERKMDGGGGGSVLRSLLPGDDRSGRRAREDHR